MNKTFKIHQLYIVRALTYARIHGIEIGSTVTHTRDGTIYYLKEIRGNIAIVTLSAEESPTGKEIIKELSRGGLYDPYVALFLSEQAKKRRRVPIDRRLTQTD